VLGAAGLSLPLASGASAAVPGMSANLPAPTASVSQQITLHDEGMRQPKIRMIFPNPHYAALPRHLSKQINRWLSINVCTILWLTWISRGRGWRRR
jgi:hypothetical protein